MEDNRAFKGVWIPKELWLDENLTKLEMCLLAEIDSLDNGDEGCFASNAKFANFLRVSTSRASQLVSSLENKGYIKTTKIYSGRQVKKRVIKVVNKLTRGSKFSKRGYLENCEDSNTSTSNTKDMVGFDEVLTYLNKKTNKNFKLIDSNKKHIEARLRDGYTLNDCKRVIDTKCKEWIGNKEMERYLNPVTLFRPSNFDRYLNETSVKEKKGTTYERY